MALASRPFAQRKRMTDRCSLRDTFSGDVSIFIVYKWRHSNVIGMKLTEDIQNEISYETYISDFSYLEN